MDKIERAKAPDTPEWYLKYLARDKDWRVRYAVSTRNDLLKKLDVLEILEGDEEFTVLANVVPLRCEDPGLLEYFADSYSTLVRQRVAVNPASPEDVLVDLSLDDSPIVRRRVVFNINCPDYVIEIVAEQDNVTVSSLLKARSYFFTKAITDNA